MKKGNRWAKTALAAALALTIAPGAALAETAEELYQNGVEASEKAEYGDALNWFWKAVEASSPDAMYELGNLYRDGSGVWQDYAKAME